MSERVLCLHIGCGKTGSSALQLWLHRSRDALVRLGWYYPGEPGKRLSDYQITSGNGDLLIGALETERTAKMLSTWFARHPRVLFSSERFQMLAPEQLQRLAAVCRRQKIRVRIIVYLRDLYDVLFSLYVQGVKRQEVTESFQSYVERTRIVQQFFVLKLYERFFDAPAVLHYDTEKSQGLERAFCRALGVDPDAMPPMSSHRVNRSLTLEELELMRRLNQICRQRFPAAPEGFLGKVSDYLIYSRPEEETAVYFDPKLARILRRRFLPELRRVNRRYFGENRLRIFRREGKRVTNRLPDIPQSYTLLLEALVTEDGCALRQGGIRSGVREALRSFWHRLAEGDRRLVERFSL